MRAFIYFRMMDGIRHAMLSLACMAAIQAGHAQRTLPSPPADTASRKVILIDHITKLIEDKEGAEHVKWLSRGVWLRVDSTRIYADSAVIFGSDRAFAYGNVVIRQGDSLNVFSDTLYYSTADDVAKLIGEAVLQQGTSQLWTRNLDYKLSERLGVYTEGGILVDGDLQLSSKQGLYFAAEERILFRDSVVVLHPKFNLAADSLTYLASVRQVLFTGPTNIYTANAKIYCESGYYDLQSETAEFSQNAQYVGGQKKGTADTIVYTAKTGDVTMLGNVFVEELDKRIRGTALYYNETTGETIIRGDPATYADSTRTMVSPEIFYNEKTSMVTTKGRSEVRDGSMILVSDFNDFDPSTGMGHAAGDVIWRDTAHHIGILKADTADYSADFMQAYGTGRQLMYVVADRDTLYIAADSFTMWQAIDTLETIFDTLLVTTADTVIAVTDTLFRLDTVRMIRACHDVRLFKSNMQGRADSLTYHGRDSLFTFFSDPVLWSDTTQFSGDTISVSLKERRIHNITLRRNALLVSEILETYYDQIRGRLIVARFDSAAIQDMWVTGNAESIYYTRDARSAFIGVNQTVCSRMHFIFDEGKVKALKYYGENTSSLKPMGQAEHHQLRLEGFRWRAEDRPRSIADLLE